MIKTSIWIFIVMWLATNIYVAVTESADEMRGDFIINQCFVGKIFSNIFYMPAWLLKVLKAIIA